jgi:nitronate monooxygenase
LNNSLDCRRGCRAEGHGLIRMLGIEHPVLLAPMDIVSGGRLAAAVSQAGGLGLLGGGYGDGDWIDQEWERAGNAGIGYLEPD